MNTATFIKLSVYRIYVMPSSLPHLSICGMNIQTRSTNSFRKTLRLHSDTVYKFIQKDPSFTAHADLTMRFDSITDSIRTRLMELADNFTLSDVAYVKLHTSIYGQDKELDSLKRQATVFFSSLDSIPVYTGNIRDLLADYSKFLLSYKLHGVHSEDALLRFIRMEDFFFRSFLAWILLI